MGGGRRGGGMHTYKNIHTRREIGGKGVRYVREGREEERKIMFKKKQEKEPKEFFI